MGFYRDNILPRIISAGMKNPAMTKHRPAVPALARGRVLELGIGSGLNIPHYTGPIERLYGLEPSWRLLDEAARIAGDAPFPVELLQSGAEAIPLPDASVDTVVSTWTLCSIPQLGDALTEVRRVLAPGGRMLFLEHGRSPEPAVARWQDRLAPVFRGMAGCNPNLAMDEIIRDAGFRFESLDMRYFDGPRFISWHYTGTAVPA